MKQVKQAANQSEVEASKDHSWMVEATTADGRRWVSGVRLGSREEAETYIDYFACFELEGYVTAEIVKSDEMPTNTITRSYKGGRPNLNFEHGTCGALRWRPVT